VSKEDLLTIGDVSDIFGVAEWRVRRSVDSIECEMVRAGLYRLIPRSQLATVGAELQRRGWLPGQKELPHAS
jgi:hypothetical protein